ncbi:hypothetical protein IE077_003786, partial [Cardiosporidium cionae]
SIANRLIGKRGLLHTPFNNFKEQPLMDCREALKNLSKMSKELLFSLHSPRSILTTSPSVSILSMWLKTSMLLSEETTICPLLSVEAHVLQRFLRLIFLPLKFHTWQVYVSSHTISKEKKVSKATKRKRKESIVDETHSWIEELSIKISETEDVAMTDDLDEISLYTSLLESLSQLCIGPTSPHPFISEGYSSSLKTLRRRCWEYWTFLVLHKAKWMPSPFQTICLPRLMAAIEVLAPPSLFSTTLQSVLQSVKTVPPSTLSFSSLPTETFLVVQSHTPYLLDPYEELRDICRCLLAFSMSAEILLIPQLNRLQEIVTGILQSLVGSPSITTFLCLPLLPLVNARDVFKEVETRMDVDEEEGGEEGGEEDEEEGGEEGGEEEEEEGGEEEEVEDTDQTDEEVKDIQPKVDPLNHPTATVLHKQTPQTLQNTSSEEGMADSLTHLFALLSSLLNKLGPYFTRSLPCLLTEIFLNPYIYSFLYQRKGDYHPLYRTDVGRDAFGRQISIMQHPDSLHTYDTDISESPHRIHLSTESLLFDVLMNVKGGQSILTEFPPSWDASPAPPTSSHAQTPPPHSRAVHALEHLMRLMASKPRFSYIVETLIKVVKEVGERSFLSTHTEATKRQKGSYVSGCITMFELSRLMEFLGYAVGCQTPSEAMLHRPTLTKLFLHIPSLLRLHIARSIPTLFLPQREEIFSMPVDSPFRRACLLPDILYGGYLWETHPSLIQQAMHIKGMPSAPSDPSESEAMLSLTRLLASEKVRQPLFGIGRLEKAWMCAFRSWCLKLDIHHLKHFMNTFRQLLWKRPSSLSEDVEMKEQQGLVEECQTLCSQRLFLMVYIAFLDDFGDVGGVEALFQDILTDFQKTVEICVKNAIQCSMEVEQEAIRKETTDALSGMPSTRKGKQGRNYITGNLTWSWFEIGLPTILAIKKSIQYWDTQVHGTLPSSFLELLLGPLVDCLDIMTVLPRSTCYSNGVPTVTSKIDQHSVGLSRIWLLTLQSLFGSIFSAYAEDLSSIERISEALIAKAGAGNANLRLSTVQIFFSIWQQLGVSAISSLSICTPTILVLLEDSDPEVEQVTQNWVKIIEATTGETLNTI